MCLLCSSIEPMLFCLCCPSVMEGENINKELKEPLLMMTSDVVEMRLVSKNSMQAELLQNTVEQHADRISVLETGTEQIQNTVDQHADAISGLNSIVAEMGIKVEHSAKGLKYMIDGTPDSSESSSSHPDEEVTRSAKHRRR